MSVSIVLVLYAGEEVLVSDMDRGDGVMDGEEDVWVGCFRGVFLLVLLVVVWRYVRWARCGCLVEDLNEQVEAEDAADGKEEEVLVLFLLWLVRRGVRAKLF